MCTYCLSLWYRLQTSYLGLCAFTGVSALLLMLGVQKAQLDKEIFSRINGAAAVIQSLTRESKKPVESQKGKQPNPSVQGCKTGLTATHYQAFNSKLLPNGVAFAHVIHFTLFFSLTILVLVTSDNKGFIRYEYVLFLLLYDVVTEVLRTLALAKRLDCLMLALI